MDKYNYNKLLDEALEEYSRMDYEGSRVTQGMANTLALCSIADSLNEIENVLFIRLKDEGEK